MVDLKQRLAATENDLKIAEAAASKDHLDSQVHVHVHVHHVHLRYMYVYMHMYIFIYGGTCTLIHTNQQL